MRNPSITPPLTPNVEAEPSRRRPAAPRRRGGETLLAYALLLPSAVLLGIFSFFPLLYAFAVSLREWRSAPGPFVGLDNYHQALTQEPEFWQSLVVTLYYVVGTVPLTIALGYLVAELLHGRLKGMGIYRTCFFMPYIVSPVAAAAVWRWIFDPTFGLATSAVARFGAQPLWLLEPRGVFELAASHFGATLPAWAAGPSVALVCIVVVSIWHSLGFAIVVLMAGLINVPTEIVEAARLDGARGWPLMRHVKLPLLSPTLFFLLIVFTIRAFQTFTQIYVMSPDNKGGPSGTTRNITMYIFSSFYDYRSRLGPGYGSAVAFILFGIILALTLFQFRLLGKRVHYQ